MFEGEQWREIEEFPNYRVSNYGRIKHVDRVEARKVTINDRGFPVVLLSSGDSPTRYLRQINKLVAKAFLRQPSPPVIGDMEQNAIWHIDGDLTNCRADNLMWDYRNRVLEWNEMHRLGHSKYKTVSARVKNNRTGVIYEDTFECAMAEGMLESDIIWRIERQARHMEDDNAHYRYLFAD
jgi:hypothetical protein